MRRRDILIGTAALALFRMTGISLAQALETSSALTSQSKLTARLVGQLESARGRGANVVISPASLAAILALLDSEADDAMRAAIHATLGFDRKSPKEAQDELAALRTTVSAIARGAEDKDATFSLANSLVIDPNSKPFDEALARLRETGAEVTVANLEEAGTIRRINEWVSDRTKGLIRKMLEAPPHEPGLVALNALYFKGFWQTQFKKEQTKPKPFNVISGAAIEVPMMHRVSAAKYRDEGRFSAVDLAYRGGRYSLVVITSKDAPAGANEFSAVGEWLSGQDFDNGTVNLSMPRFTLNESAELLAPLDAMGLRAGRMSPTAFAKLARAPQQISAITQRTYLRVDEEGTEAAAATSVVTTRSAMREREFKMVVDKPFMFALRDRSSGLLLMSGYVGRPVSLHASVANNADN